jgi:hypothetical protein
MAHSAVDLVQSDKNNNVVVVVFVAATPIQSMSIVSVVKSRNGRYETFTLVTGKYWRFGCDAEQ